jgi:hypothetical protein
MKPLNAVCAVAGAMAVVGAAAPAFAYDSADLTPTSLNGGLNTLTSSPIDVNTVQNQDGVGGLLGGLPLNR